MIARRRRAAVLVAATVLVAVVGVLTAPAAAPPLYDGLCLPPRYRYLSPPPGQDGGPASVRRTISVTGGQLPAAVVQTGEPLLAQMQVLLGPGGLALPAGAVTVTVSITPVPAAVDAPDGRHLDGNVYRVTAAAGGRVVEPPRGNPATVVMAATRQGDDVVARREGLRWLVLPSTQRFGCAFTVAADTDRFGDFALLGAPSSGVATATAASIAVAAAAVLLLVLVLVRARRT